MPVQPRSSDEIRQSIIARIVNVSLSGQTTVSLTDVAEGGILHTILGAISDELMVIEARGAAQALAHGLGDDVRGELLHDRVRELGYGFPGAQGSREARGGHPVIVRSTTTSSLTIQPGRLVLGRGDNPNVTASNVDEIVFDVGQAVYPGPGDDPITMQAKAPGSAGNGGAGAYRVLVEGPSDVIQAITASAMSGGVDGESESELRHRARLWVASFGRSQPTALESAALEFRTQTGEGFLYAKHRRDHTVPGVSYLVVDNGYGMEGYQRSALPRSQTVPTLVGGARHTFTFEFPAATPPQVSVTREGVTTTYAPTGDWAAAHELGILRTVPTPVTLDLQPGDTVVVGGHQVYTGIIALFQAHVTAHLCAAGTRVIVVPARPLYVSLSANVVALDGYDLADVTRRAKIATEAFFLFLAPGEPLLMHELHAALDRVEGLKNIVFDQTDKYPGSDFYRLTTLQGLLNFH